MKDFTTMCEECPKHTHPRLTDIIKDLDCEKCKNLRGCCGTEKGQKEQIEYLETMTKVYAKIMEINLKETNYKNYRLGDTIKGFMDEFDDCGYKEKGSHISAFPYEKRQETLDICNIIGYNLFKKLSAERLKQQTRIFEDSVMERIIKQYGS